MKKVLFLIGSLEGGGAEKTLVDLINNLDHSKYDMTVMTIHNKGVYIKEISKHVKYRSILNIYKFNNKFVEFISRVLVKIMTMIPGNILYRLFIHENYDVEVAYLEGMSTKIISGSTNKSSKKYAWVHTDPSIHTWSTLSYSSFFYEKECYKKFDKILCVSTSVRNSFEKKYGLAALVQYNVLNESHIIQNSKESIRGYWKSDIFKVITVGRLVPQKGYDRLLKVHKRLIEEGFEYELLILGDGDQKEQLINYIQQNNLENTIRMLGFQKNPYKYMKNSDLFVCSSITEGFSTVATEAIILGIPVVTTNCAGMNDLLGNSDYGIITENNEEDLYKGLKKILSNKELFKYYQKKARERKEYFKLNNRIKEFDEILGG